MVKRVIHGGRDTDALIAKNIMGGFCEDPDALTDKPIIQFWVHPRDGVLISQPYPYPQSTQCGHQWRRFYPSSSISDAIIALEHTEKDYEIQKVALPEYNSLEHGVAIYTCKIADGNVWVSDYAYALPLAICRALLTKFPAKDKNVKAIVGRMFPEQP